ncbi:MAG: PilZ domain-containing protein [bacterium]|nr:PilZ domain-containing protein [bacterium]
MSVELKEVKNLKIVPKNYESGTACEIKEIGKEEVKINLPLASKIELEDYMKGEEIEAFGLEKHGLVYFTSEIIDKNDKELLIKYPAFIKEIQRRKYSRVPFDGKLTVLNRGDFKIQTDDISAGGLRFTSDTPFMVGDEYEIKVELVNNLVIECLMQPIRVEETEDEKGLPYSVSAKFKKIRSIDRIALMQYSLRLISESENKA